MSEKIINIEEDTFVPENNAWDTCDGYRVTTDKQIILVGISNDQLCCENFGYISTPDDVKEFIGAELLSIARVDTALKKHECLEYMDAGDAIFINLETSKGTLQLAVYNAHNGYYGHTAFVKSESLNIEEAL